jgi:hypothetical protein
MERERSGRAKTGAMRTRPRAAGVARAFGRRLERRKKKKKKKKKKAPAPAVRRTGRAREG